MPEIFSALTGASDVYRASEHEGRTEPVTALRDRVTVVTGAGRGIGRAIALACARSGARVVLVSRSQDELESVATLISEDGGEALVVPTDLREPAQIEQLAATVRRQLGDVQVLINNSGVAGPTGPLWEIPLDEWEDTLRVNLTGVYLCCRAFLPAMIARGRGSIVVIGSSTGKRPLHGRTPYAASKLGLVGLVRTLAWEIGPHGIRVNLISPGPTAGNRLDSVVEAQAAARSLEQDQVRQEFLEASPLRRFVDPGDLAEVAVFLASDAAASITGEDVNVSTGMTMY